MKALKAEEVDGRSFKDFEDARCSIGGFNAIYNLWLGRLLGLYCYLFRNTI
jgi:hypothetical protein